MTVSTAAEHRPSAAEPDARRVMLRAWAGWNDLAYEEHGTETAVRARREANRIMDQLEPLSDADWGVIRMAQREYVSESRP